MARLGERLAMVGQEVAAAEKRAELRLRETADLAVAVSEVRSVEMVRNLEKRLQLQAGIRLEASEDALFQESDAVALALEVAQQRRAGSHARAHGSQMPEEQQSSIRSTTPPSSWLQRRPAGHPIAPGGDSVAASTQATSDIQRGDAFAALQENDEQHTEQLPTEVTAICLQHVYDRVSKSAMSSLKIRCAFALCEFARFGGSRAR
jgi:hypothetical protein